MAFNSILSPLGRVSVRRGLQPETTPTHTHTPRGAGEAEPCRFRGEEPGPERCCRRQEEESPAGCRAAGGQCWSNWVPPPPRFCRLPCPSRRPPSVLPGTGGFTPALPEQEAAPRGAAGQGSCSAQSLCDPKPGPRRGSVVCGAGRASPTLPLSWVQPVTASPSPARRGWMRTSKYFQMLKSHGFVPLVSFRP